MSDIKQELDKIRGRISEPSFLKNEGLSNEVGIHVFCYDPADELIVRDFVSRLKAESGTPYHIKECDLRDFPETLGGQACSEIRGRAGRKTRKGIPSQAASKDRDAGGTSGIHEVRAA